VAVVVADGNLALCKVALVAAQIVQEVMVVVDLQVQVAELCLTQVEVVLVLAASHHQLNTVLTAVAVTVVPDILPAEDQVVLRGLVVVDRVDMMVMLLAVAVEVADSEVEVEVVKPLLVAGVADTLIPITVSPLAEHRAQAELQETLVMQIAEQPVLEHTGFSLQDQVIQD
jgi:hypothetical protein